MPRAALFLEVRCRTSSPLPPPAFGASPRSSAPCFPSNLVRAPVKLYLASSSAGKLAEYRALTQTLASSCAVELELLAQVESLPALEEGAPSFAEDAAGKALHYSRFADALVFAYPSSSV